jgi:deoxyribonuclease-4
MAIRFGPAGLGGVDSAIDNLQEFHKRGLAACEIAFTYGIYIKDTKDAEKIRQAAKELDIRLSIHAPYWINLNSKEKIKIEESKKRILDCCEIGDLLGAYRIVFHPGYYGGIDKEETYQNIKKAVLEMQEEIKKNKWKIALAPETTGKINVFGSVDEILRLAEETGCSFTIDFAHILAREKKVDYEEILGKFKKYKELHIHFSGIEYGEKGERRHIKTKDAEIKELLAALKKYAQGKEIVIINESPDMVEDSVKSLKLLF